MEMNDRDLQVIISGKEDPNITITDQWGDSQLTKGIISAIIGITEVVKTQFDKELPNSCERYKQGSHRRTDPKPKE